MCVCAWFFCASVRTCLRMRSRVCAYELRAASADRSSSEKNKSSAEKHGPSRLSYDYIINVSRTPWFYCSNFTWLNDIIILRKPPKWFVRLSTYYSTWQVCALLPYRNTRLIEIAIVNSRRRTRHRPIYTVRFAHVFAPSAPYNNNITIYTRYYRFLYTLDSSSAKFGNFIYVIFFAPPSPIIFRYSITTYYRSAVWYLPIILYYL